MTRPLRVLHIASGDLWAGAEVQAFTLMSRLVKLPETRVGAVLMNEGTLADRLRSVGIPVYVLDERSMTSFRIFAGLRAVLRSWRPDVLHTHREKENILGSLANRSCRNVPSVRTVHGGKEHSGAEGLGGVRHRLVSSLDRWCGQSLQQRIIAVTRELGVRMVREFPAEKIVVIENGVDFDAVRRDMGTAEFRTMEPGATHIGMAGRLVEVKRVDTFLETAAALLRDCPERQWRFHVFGEGPMRLSLEELSVRLRLSDHVIFHGHREDIATCVGGLDALVICSDHEGMPMISLEAAALGVPTVAHAVGGLVEVVPEQFQVVRHDVRGYQEGILRALREDGRAIVAQHLTQKLRQFSAQRNAERIRALYAEVVAESHEKGGARWQARTGSMARRPKS